MTSAAACTSPGGMAPPVRGNPCTPIATLTAQQVYAFAAALLADDGESSVHNISRPQNDAPHPWCNTLRLGTRIRDANRMAPPPGPQQGEALVVQAAGY